ncbi:MAG TPA: PH domain-containing protein [Micromonosporaceae bacterium]
MVETPQVVRARPRKAAVVCWIAAVTVVLVFSAVATALRGETEGGGVFGFADQVAMVGLGLLGAAGILAFTRPRVEADQHGIRVRNVIGSYSLPWGLVRGVRFGRGSPWASLELVNDDLLPVMAIQAADREYAVAAVRQVRALHAGHGGKPGAEREVPLS